MKRTAYLVITLATMLFAACSSEESVVNPEITLQSDSEILIASTILAQKIITFSSTQEWEATSENRDWYNFSPKQGKAGVNNITVTATESNNTGNSRIGVITITSQGVSKQVTIRQDNNNLILASQSTYTMSPDGGTIDIALTTNISSDRISLRSSSSWITLESDTKALERGSVKVNISANPEGDERSGTFTLEDTITGTTSSPIEVIQEGKESSEADGQIFLLQEASKGAGVPIVIMGDAFLYTDITSGTYMEVMKKAMENLFTEEPMTSLRSYFNVYAVTAVSKNNTYGSKYKTAFSCTLEGGGSTLISGDHSKCIEYAQKIPNININEALIIIILNTNVYAGTAYFGFATGSGKTIELGIGYCPIIKNLQSESFRQVLVHEAAGHAYTKLFDEYAYQSEGTMPETEKRQIKQYQTNYGWAMNVDTTPDPKAVVWAKFIADNRYKWENIGVYEGAGTYIKGAYRSTRNSMMNDNTIGFNAPSREAIYKRTLKLAYGAGFVYDYETFVAFDLSYQQSLRQRQTSTRSGNEYRPMFAPPVILNQRIPALK